jgi:hypothetical protein
MDPHELHQRQEAGRTDFPEAELQQADLHGVDLRRADLHTANLKDADLAARPCAPPPGSSPAERGGSRML